jgi:hypothetical protein
MFQIWSLFFIFSGYILYLFNLVGHDSGHVKTFPHLKKKLIGHGLSLKKLSDVKSLNKIIKLN